MKELPPGVALVAAAKTRGVDEIRAAASAGVKIIGENYVQEAEEVFKVLGKAVRWHFIGHLQKNKVKKAVRIFDMIETVDSLSIAGEIDKRSAEICKVMPVLIELNSAREPNKSGVKPEEVKGLIEKVSTLKNVKVLGLMTMGPLAEDGEGLRPFFRLTRNIFDGLKADAVPGAEMKYLSMGMTSSYKVAIEEGANLVRVGTKIFGERVYENG